jgi:hypothetical protein
MKGQGPRGCSQCRPGVRRPLFWVPIDGPVASDPVTLHGRKLAVARSKCKGYVPRLPFHLPRRSLLRSVRLRRRAGKAVAESKEDEQPPTNLEYLILDVMRPPVPLL